MTAPTIWITGGKGFIGRHLARYAGEHARVYGIGHGFWPQAEASRWSFAHWVNGEIDFSNLSQLLRVSGPPDTVFHLAGGSSVGLSFQNPQEDFGRTVETTARLLEWLRLHAPTTGLVCVSSAAVYGAGRSGCISESTPIEPFSPYGYHKAMMESLARSYGRHFGLKTALVRLFSVYGPELEKQLIWDICGKLEAGADAPLVLGGTGRELRDWLHVSDAVRLLWLMRSACGPESLVINGGTGRATAVAEVARAICEAWGISTEVRFTGHSRPGDPESLVADVARAKSLGFSATVSLDHGSVDTVSWFQSRKGSSSKGRAHAS